MQEFIQQLINGLSSGAIYALIAVGYTMVYGVLRLINFAHGDVYMVGAMVGLYLLARTPVLSATPTWDAGTVLIGVLLVLELAYQSVRLAARLVRLASGRGQASTQGLAGARVVRLLPPAIGIAAATVLLILCPRVRFVPVERPPSWLALLGTLAAAMAVCGYLGYRIERIAYRPLRNQPRILALITAIGVSMFLEYGGQQMFGPNPQGFAELPRMLPGSTERPVTLGSGGATVRFNGTTIEIGDVTRRPDGQQPKTVVIASADILVFVTALVLMVLLWWIVMKTRTGMALRAVSWRFDTAALMGINIDRIVSFTFVLGSALAAVAGILVAYRSSKVEPMMGLIPGIKAFVAAVLGGIGNVPGALVGGLLLGMTEVMVSAYFPSGSQYRDGVAFVILIGVLLVRPSGLLGSNVVEKV